MTTVILQIYTLRYMTPLRCSVTEYKPPLNNVEVYFKTTRRLE
nr:MAG TPA: hypothetical protein [Caudoviricetes sp.]